MNTLEKNINSCKSWEELFAVIDANSDPITNSGGEEVKPSVLKAHLVLIRENELPLNMITRNHGLRAKALELIQAAVLA